jgi:ABC-type lipoprotein release transport system permease subunit
MLVVVVVSIVMTIVSTLGPIKQMVRTHPAALLASVSDTSRCPRPLLKCGT